MILVLIPIRTAILIRMFSKRIFLDVVYDATGLLGAQVREGRLKRRWTAAELAERAGMSKATLLKIEHGDPSVSLGLALHAAALVGVPLFDRDERSLSDASRTAQDTLLRRRMRPRAEPGAEPDLDF
ncbi:helix-turn-helix domain-containing protein [Miltoncostaea oceani]|uniref:helix-turn-helix domain-containing protein n=1 Tax=Miltoncostaea oceani TaxID=2843216 RepID=UPI001FE4E6AC|nr:helix-turn-helix transcriptional regulator [Miltoncostaea oceani]